MRIIQGIGLLAADRGGTSDPYVTIHHAGKKLKTSIIRETLNPVWDETFIVYVSGYVRFHVKDWDRLSRDDSLGQVRPLPVPSLDPAHVPTLVFVWGARLTQLQVMLSAKELRQLGVHLKGKEVTGVFVLQNTTCGKLEVGFTPLDDNFEVPGVESPQATNSSTWQRAGLSALPSLFREGQDNSPFPNSDDPEGLNPVTVPSADTLLPSTVMVAGEPCPYCSLFCYCMTLS